MTSAVVEERDVVLQVETVYQSIRRFRDWRIDLRSRDQSVVFTPQKSSSQLGVIVAGSMHGKGLSQAFAALESGLATAMRALSMGDRPIPRYFTCTIEGVRLRAQHVREQTYHLRVIGELLSLEALGMPSALKEYLMSSQLDSGGLVVICGGYGSGKTTTVNAVIKARVENNGGYAMVLGAPIEYTFQGLHGTQERPGYVEQLDVSGKDLSEEVRAAMRNFPSGATSILAFPEVLGAAGVGEMLRAANRGNLVLADMHAKNIEGAITLLASMAALDGEPYGRELLGNALQAVVLQHSSLKGRTGAQGSGQLQVGMKHKVIDSTLRAGIANIHLPLPQLFAGNLSMNGG